MKLVSANSGNYNCHAHLMQNQLLSCSFNLHHQTKDLHKIQTNTADTEIRLANTRIQVDQSAC